MWSTLLAILCGAGIVAGSPVAMEARDSSQLPMEHRHKDPDPMEVFAELVDTVFKSRTASALDEVASHVTTTIGGFVDDIGDFFVSTVKDIPSTIEKITERVDNAVQNGEEQVMIIVKGVRNSGLNGTVASASNAAGQTVDQVFTAVNQSKTLTSMQELDKSIRLSIARIGASILANIDDIDHALAQGIRTVTRTGENNTETSDSSPKAANTVSDVQDVPPAVENEVRSL